MVNLRKALFSNKSFVFYIIIVVFSLFSMAFELGSAQKIFSEAGMNVISFFQSGIHGVSSLLRESFTSLAEIGRLQEENQRLITELQIYRQRTRNFEELVRENDQLRRLLDFPLALEDQLIPARIIAKSPGNLSNEFTINRGTIHGVEINDPVITFTDGERFLIGRISSVSLRSSLIIPVFAPNHFVAARLIQNRFEGLVSGLGDSQNRLLMNYVDRDARTRISLGELVVTSGMQSVFPQGLILGKVENISADPWDSGLRITLEPGISFSTLEFVFVLKKGSSF
jgi:rod shape-determining protein MreC